LVLRQFKLQAGTGAGPTYCRFFFVPFPFKRMACQGPGHVYLRTHVTVPVYHASPPFRQAHVLIGIRPPAESPSHSPFIPIHTRGVDLATSTENCKVTCPVQGTRNYDPKKKVHCCIGHCRLKVSGCVSLPWIPATAPQLVSHFVPVTASFGDQPRRPGLA